MKVRYTSFLATFQIALQAVSAFPNILSSSSPTPQRRSSILIDHPAFPPLPHPQQAATESAAVGLNLSDIQGDILIGMKKKSELFFVFTIVDPKAFKSHLGSDIVPLITSTNQLLAVGTQPTTAVNLAFSQRGLNALGIHDNLGDDLFAEGQLPSAESLGDRLSDWKPAFTQGRTHIHGIFLLASDTVGNVNATLSQIQQILKGSISEVFRVQAQARPGDQAGHEHFGFLDGMSNPTVKGFSPPFPGQALVDPGVILVKEPGDSVPRPAWAKDGAFLVFRQLQQFAPEFNKYLVDNALSEPNLTPEQNAELLGARIIGRWKSGAPIDLVPRADDPALGADPQRNNNFDFNHTDAGFNLATNQSYCPFSSHIRKTNPRADLGGTSTFKNHFIRAGIPYGPEITDAERASNSSGTDPSLERGLVFAAYQANIAQGFAFLQRSFANNVNFLRPNTGFDLLIGRANGAPRKASGLDPSHPEKNFVMNRDFIISRGGEYFFSPSISAIRNTLSK